MTGSQPEAVREYIVTQHAIEEMKRRGLAESIIHQVLTRPEQREAVRPGRDVLQSRIHVEDKSYLVRVFVDVDRTPTEVVTAYRTSRIQRYWRSEP